MMRHEREREALIQVLPRREDSKPVSGAKKAPGHQGSKVGP